MPFKVLSPIHTFRVGDVVDRHDFPVGVDLRRLVNLKILRPAGGEPIELRDDDAAGWKAEAVRLRSRLQEADSVPRSEFDALTRAHDALADLVEGLRGELAETKASAARELHAAQQRRDQELIRQRDEAVQDRNAAIAERDALRAKVK